MPQWGQGMVAPADCRGAVTAAEQWLHRHCRTGARDVDGDGSVMASGSVLTVAPPQRRPDQTVRFGARDGDPLSESGTSTPIDRIFSAIASRMN